MYNVYQKYFQIINLKYFQVLAVEQVFDKADEVSDQEFKKLEEKLELVGDKIQPKTKEQ